MSPADGTDAPTERDSISERVTIFRTPRSPNWYVQYNEDGKQFKPSLKTRSLKQARILAKQIDARLTLGMTLERRRRAVTIEESVEKYLQSQEVHLDPKSLTLYKRDLLQFAAFSREIKMSRLDQASAEHLEAFEDRLRKVGAPRIRKYPRKKKPEEKKIRAGPNSSKTIRSKMKTLRQMIRWAVRRRLIDHDPAPGYRLPPENRSKPELFTAKELKAILEAAQPPFRDLFDFFRLTGLRNQELCWLLKGDIDPQLRFIYVRAKKCPISGVLWRPKHGRERIVPLCPEAAEIARRHLAQANGPWLFHASDTWGSRPGQFKNGRIWRALKNVLKKLGINHGTVHTFRHCFCSYLANQHISPYLVKEFMGHLKLDTVLAYYQAGANDLLTGMALVSFGQMLADAESKESSQVLANRDKAGPGRTNTTAEQKES